MRQSIDARGLSCPQPVLEAKKAMEKYKSAGEIEILVDTATSRENVGRFAKKNGHEVETKEIDGGYSVLIKLK